MATVQQEMVTIWNTLIRPAVPNPTTLDSAIDLTTWTAKDNGDDPFAFYLATAFINIRGPKSIGWLNTLTTPQKLTLYDEVNAVLLDAVTQATAVYTPLHTAYVALVG